MKQYLNYKLAQHGIRLHEIEESYTSRHVLSAKREKKHLPACLCAGVGRVRGAS
ncbi:hypothetical protein ABET52_16600 [Saccharococcus caldoxylosilyticus]|uniref:hypothetical protein n=1 Tax=Saccharococcus caldoxylosilyticus TaxID=81408 RepID=UPI001F351422|nr:hypothetical protein [Parageobacillus caldoxylosilyticus]